MQQNAFVAVDEGDFRFAGCGRGETVVKSKTLLNRDYEYQ